MRLNGNGLFFDYTGDDDMMRSKGKEILCKGVTYLVLQDWFVDHYFYAVKKEGSTETPKLIYLVREDDTGGEEWGA